MGPRFGRLTLGANALFGGLGVAFGLKAEGLPSGVVLVFLFV